MGQVILITSGKGGVGKSTICTMLGAALVRQGNKVLMLESDCGLRNLDIMNGLDQKVVYDLGDVLTGRCEPIKAILESPHHPELWLLPAANSPSFIPSPEKLESLISGLASYYDYLLVDCPAGFNQTLTAACKAAQMGLVVVTPDLISVKDGGKATDILVSHGLGNSRLIINKLPKRFIPTQSLPDLDAVIDLVGLQLIGIVPDDSVMSECINSGRPCEAAISNEVFSNIARRLKGKWLPLRVGG